MWEHNCESARTTACHIWEHTWERTHGLTKCCACTSRFAQCRACHENQHFEVYKVLRLPWICASRFTKCCACPQTCAKVHRALCLPWNLHIKIHMAQPCQCLSQQTTFPKTTSIKMPKRSFCAIPPKFWKRATCPKFMVYLLHLPRNQSNVKTTTKSKVLRLPRILRIEVKRFRPPAPATKSRLQTTNFM